MVRLGSCCRFLSSGAGGRLTDAVGCAPSAVRVVFFDGSSFSLRGAFEEETPFSTRTPSAEVSVGRPDRASLVRRGFFPIFFLVERWRGDEAPTHESIWSSGLRDSAQALAGSVAATRPAPLVRAEPTWLILRLGFTVFADIGSTTSFGALRALFCDGFPPTAAPVAVSCSLKRPLSFICTMARIGPMTSGVQVSAPNISSAGVTTRLLPHPLPSWRLRPSLVLSTSICALLTPAGRASLNLSTCWTPTTALFPNSSHVCS